MGTTMEYSVGQKVELNPLGHARVEGGKDRPKNRRRGVILGRMKAYPNSYRIKWGTRKSEDRLHVDFLMDASEYVEPACPKTATEKAAELRRPDDGDPFNAGFNAALDEVSIFL